ncbi:MAG: flagellar hook-associated protein FlgK [Lachnospiraceae bacterium]|nr:flagellar hook-associated protein FlgK [Lachnospiraceae bacterium]
MSTFFGLSIAESGLRVYHAAANTTANNISNVNTKGYSKQVLNTSSSAAIRSYTSWGTISTGVTADSVTQLRSQFYDNKYRAYTGYQSEFETKNEYMLQIENYFRDDSTVRGFGSIYDTMFSSLDSLSTSPADTTVRNQFISDAQNFCSFFNTVASSLESLQQDVNEQINSTVSQVNSIAQKISILNSQINSVEISGSYANELRDERALLVDELSKYVATETKETEVVNSNYPDMYTGATNFEIKINGQLLVDGDRFRQLNCVARDYRVNQSDTRGLYDVYWADNGENFNPTSLSNSGNLKALFELRDGNNEEAFSGTVKSISGTAVTVVKPTLTDENSMTMPQNGTISIGSKNYSYSGFDMYNDLEGNAQYVFYIDSDPNGLSSTAGKTAALGSDIDYKGIPYYQAQMNEFVRAFAKSFNEIEQEGVDLYGNPMGAFFVAESVTGSEIDFYDEPATYFESSGSNYYQLTAGNIRIAKASRDDPSVFSTAMLEKYQNGIDDEEMTNRLLTLQKDTVMYRGSSGQQFLQYIMSDVTIDTEESQLLSNNYYTIANTVANQRTSVSGVDEDEEALDLLKFQNAYSLCSKVISVMTEMYDKLINQTGV